MKNEQHVCFITDVIIIDLSIMQKKNLISKVYALLYVTLFSLEDIINC